MLGETEMLGGAEGEAEGKLLGMTEMDGPLLGCTETDGAIEIEG